jgi:hypothetical protein
MDLASLASAPGSRQRNPLPRVAVPLLSALVLTAVHPGVAHGQASSAVSGRWEGILYPTPNFMRLELQLSADPSGALTGELAFRTLEDQPRDILVGFGDGIVGRARMGGTWDPATRTFEIRPVEWIEDPRRPSLRLHLAGVLATDPDGLAGHLVAVGQPPTPAFVFTRPGGDAERLRDEAREAMNARPNRQLGRLGGLFGGGADLRAWSDRLRREYPDTDFRNTSIESVVAMGQSLFYDEHFEPFFDKTYEELNGRDLARYVDGFSAGRADDQALAREFGALAYGFQGRGVPVLTVSVLAQRVIRRWQGQVEAWWAQAEPGTVGSDELRAMATAIEENLAPLWPSERAEVTTRFRDRRQRLILPGLTAGRDDIVAGVDGIQGIVRLDAWLDRNAEELSWLDDDARAQLLGPVEGRRGVLQAQVAANLEAELHALPSTAAGLDQGAQWFRGFEAVRSDLDPNHASGLLQTYEDVRNRQIAAVASDLAGLVGRASSRRELFAIPGVGSVVGRDLQRPGARPLATALEERLDMFERIDALSITEAQLRTERALAARQDEPTTEELYLALRDYFGAQNALLSAAMRRCRQAENLDPVTALTCLVQMGSTGGEEAIRTDITGFRKEECAPTSEGSTYLCEFRLVFRQNTVAFEGALGDLVRLLMQADSGRGYFTETPLGWVFRSAM